jgi:hypothetical protein
MQQQEQLSGIAAELVDLANLALRSTRNSLVRSFCWRFIEQSKTFSSHISGWVTPFQTDPKPDFLALTLLDQLATLLLEEFSENLEPLEKEYVTRISLLCVDMCALLNRSMDHPENSPLTTPLDSPATRRSLRIEFDRVLRSPVQQMMIGIKRMLAQDNLDDKQRQYLTRALANCRNLYEVLRTAGPLIETQNFRALALLSHKYRTPFCGITGYFELLLQMHSEGITNTQRDQLHDLVSHSRTVLGMTSDLIDATKFLSGDPPIYGENLVLSQHR